MSKAADSIEEDMFQNEKGQMAVFIALFFQVIFVFFAMAINVGLVVHDKINLQNAVDLAAYYGAMKQAQSLNQIAHINYQMRQNYKLFAWRYRILGTIGNQNHPLNFKQFNDAGRMTLRSDTASWNPVAPGAPVPANDILPSVCVAHSYFFELQELDSDAASVCLSNDVYLPRIRTSFPATGIVPGSGSLGSIFTHIESELRKFCLEAGVFNWLYAARVLAAYRVDGLLRKRMVRKIAGNLSQNDPRDLRGESIREGVFKTFRNNLTNTNRASIDANPDNFRYLNSMSAGGCGDQFTWLPEIKIQPTIFFTDWNVDRDPDSGGTCERGTAVPNRNDPAALFGRTATGDGYPNLPSAFSPTHIGGGFAGLYSSTLANDLKFFWAGEPNASEPINSHSSVGFEKNPWCMVYTGVQATTTIRKPFDPTGGTVTLNARGYAKPFGGRIGPWYGRTWPRGSGSSNAGSRENDMVDPLLPSRAGGMPSPTPDSWADVANHSRNPGDNIGINSLRTFSAMIQQVVALFNHRSKDDPPPIASANYDHLGSEVQQSGTKDPLARSADAGRARTLVTAKQRRFEMAAISPDLFDLTYYMVEPRYFDNYMTPITYGGGAIFTTPEKLYDFGGSEDDFDGRDPAGGPPSKKDFNVQEQIEVAKANYMPGYQYYVREWAHLLNSWHQKGAVDFDFDFARFGKCIKEVENKQYPVPGDCHYGGRVGYSVKMVSRDYLENGNHELGGASGSGGAILNRPGSSGF